MIAYRYSGKGFQDRGDAGAYPRDWLVSLYRSMLRVRLVEEEIAARYHLDEMKTPVHLSIGQEAASIGACAALETTDHVYASHRTHGPYLAKGGDLKAMMSELYCRANGCVGSRGGSMHLLDKKAGLAGASSIVGGIIPIAAGAALAMQIKGSGQVATVFFGEAANEEGVTSETLNFAALKKLPLVFLCENNFYSVCTPLSERQPGTRMHERAAAFGVESVVVDGMNVIDVFEAMRAAVARARSGGGATFIEALVYRFRAHAGAADDSASGYREVAEREHWEQFCPLKLYRAYLERVGRLAAGEHERLEAELKKEILDAFDHAIRSPNPVEADLSRHVYALG